MNLLSKTMPWPFHSLTFSLCKTYSDESLAVSSMFLSSVISISRLTEFLSFQFVPFIPKYERRLWLLHGI
ncbi:unnamed protein product [Citrullus colocynthis]|uniref:Uncharacterized protein n=1 Tax=Citrullus colocynthis TaxID=252529 RepID=A0ABP0ZAY9_9ROSI